MGLLDTVRLGCVLVCLSIGEGKVARRGRHFRAGCFCRSDGESGWGRQFYFVEMCTKYWCKTFSVQEIDFKDAGNGRRISNLDPQRGLRSSDLTRTSCRRQRIALIRLGCLDVRCGRSRVSFRC